MKTGKLVLTIIISLAATANFAQNSIYLGGYDGKTAKVWKDGKVLYTLSDGKEDVRVNKILVQNNDLYAFAGYYGGTVWKNGEAIVTEKSIAANEYVPSWKNYIVTFKSFCVSGNDVYVAGVDYIWWRTGTTSNFSDIYLRVWKNGIRLYTLAKLELTRIGAAVDMGNVFAMCVSNGDLYISGDANTSSGRNYYMWKNNQELPFENKPVATSISVEGNDVYVTGHTTDAYGVWKNGKELRKHTIGTLGINDVFVSGNDIYAVTSSQVWKNGVSLYNLGEEASANSIYVSGNDIYVGGRYTYYKAKVWKNGTELYTLSDGTSGAGITSVFVGSPTSSIKEIPRENKISVSGNTLLTTVPAAVYSVTGQMLYSGVQEAVLPRGIYIVRIEDENRKVIIKQ
jgi:hypothetical protein